MSQSQSNPWKVATFCIIASIAGALAAGVVVARVQNARHQLAQQTASDSLPAQAESEPVAEIAPIPELEPTPKPAAAAAPNPAATPKPVVAAAPKPSVENCERYRYKTSTDGGRVVKNGLIGGALGAGLGAAGGAIGGSAGKGAGFGALAGATAGSGYTLYDEHKQKQASQDAYYACLNRNGS